MQCTITFNELGPINLQALVRIAKAKKNHSHVINLVHLVLETGHKLGYLVQL